MPHRRPTVPAQEGESLLLHAMWRALRVYRVLALVYGAWGAWGRRDEMASPAGVLAVFVVLAAWTAFMTWQQSREVRMHLGELVVALLAVLSTRWLDSPDAALEGVTTVPGVWQSVPVVAIALILGWRGGLAVALIVTAAMIAVVGRLDAEPVSNAGLLIMLGTCIGYAADVSRAQERALRGALARQAEARERDRLARTVHDGVLQTLAFIHRRGLEIGGESARLGVLAAQQERALRTLASGRPLPELEAVIDGPVDLREALTVASTGVATLVTPDAAVLLEPRRAQEVVAAVEAALDNVRRHAGEGARAWVLLDDLGSDVVITVRDNGIGVTAADLADAADRGRLGVSASITSRLTDLGGRATYLFGPGGGTTVEMWLPKQMP